MPTISRSRANPSLTPRTALATSARVRPCRARSLRSSPERAKVTLWPSTLHVIPSGSACLRATFPFSIDTVFPAVLTLTPLGSGIGCFPMRDTATPSPDRADDFAADAALARLPPGHQPLRRRHDGQPQAAHHRRDRVMPAVDTLAGLAHALQPGDERRPLGVVAQRDPDPLEAALLHHGGIGDVPFRLEDGGDPQLHSGVGDVGARVARP